MNMTEVIKIEKPLSSNDLGDPWLLYDKNRAHLEERTEGFISEKVKAALGDASKGYFQAEWTSEGWKIGDHVMAEDW